MYHAPANYDKNKLNWKLKAKEKNMENNNKIKQKPLTENGQIEYNGQNVKKKNICQKNIVLFENRINRQTNCHIN